MLLYLFGESTDKTNDKKEWTSFYHPDIKRADDKSTWVTESNLDSLEECREWMKNISNKSLYSDYEYGYGYKYETSIQTTVCTDTIQ